MENQKYLNQVCNVATEFSNNIKRLLTEEEFEDLKRRNEETPPPEGVCWSHDYLDANMAMDEAMTAFFGEKPLSELINMSIWNDAWEMARVTNFDHVEVMFDTVILWDYSGKIKSYNDGRAVRYEIEWDEEVPDCDQELEILIDRYYDN